MLRHSLIILLATIIFFRLGCSTIPKESVTLSQGIGQGVAESHRSYVNLLNKYFAEKAKALDEFFEKEYAPAYIRNVRRQLEAANENPETFLQKGCFPKKVSSVLQLTTKRRQNCGLLFQGFSQRNLGSPLFDLTLLVGKRREHLLQHTNMRCSTEKLLTRFQRALI